LSSRRAYARPSTHARDRERKSNGRRGGRARAIALFGGSFDPIHSGHLAVARAAVRRFRLDAVHFIPSGRPPHKPPSVLSPFPHRFAMVALACAGESRFVASLAEAPAGPRSRAFYSVDTVARYRGELRPADRLYFIVGADSFLQLPTWRRYQALLDSCDFIVASRPGSSLGELRRVVPPRLLRLGRGAQDVLRLRRTAVHLLSTVHSRVSSTEIRRRARAGRGIGGLVPPLVEEYIRKQALYR
jgi:nicotinate-nucleotide adenylyltransferase